MGAGRPPPKDQSARGARARLWPARASGGPEPRRAPRTPPGLSPLHCEWVDIRNPDPNLAGGQTSCFAQGRAQGGAVFNRLEGLYRGEGNSIYFISTSGGQAQRGQLWRYRATGAAAGLLTLVFESPSSAVLDSPDNMCVTPSGAILFCEDDASGDNDTHPLAPGFVNVDRLIGLSRDGVPFEFALNIGSQTEFAGACFSPA